MHEGVCDLLVCVCDIVCDVCVCDIVCGVCV